MSARLLEALVSQRGGRWTVDAKAASEAELIEAVGVAHSCIYRPISASEARETKARAVEVEIYGAGGGYVKNLHLIKSKVRR